MANIKDRERKVVIEKLSVDDATRIGVELGKKMGKILSKAEEEVNRLCKIYGVQAQVAVKFTNLKTGKESDPVTFNQEN